MIPEESHNTRKTGNRTQGNFNTLPKRFSAADFPRVATKDSNYNNRINTTIILKANNHHEFIPPSFRFGGIVV